MARGERGDRWDRGQSEKPVEVFGPFAQMVPSFRIPATLQARLVMTARTLAADVLASKGAKGSAMSAAEKFSRNTWRR